MEYIVSARKYRPASFGSVVGQQALTTTLKNAVTTGKLAHAYLFCGPRGVGKTTCARIFSKVINCSNLTPEGDACGECESCKAFEEQRSLNIFELDAASNNSVNEMRDLMEQTRIPPQVGKYKVFIIDEVHMLSTAAFNAFLKTLEEPPSYVVFILATTEKHKILPTIISRCQVFDFERMTVTNTIEHLKKVADDQGITYEDEALALIAEKADGGMRDALSIFDQAASFCQGNITYAKVLEDLNVLDADNYFKCIDLALETKVSETMVLLNGVMEKGFDGGHFVNGLASHVRNVLMAKDAQTVSLIETSDTQRKKYAEQAQRCPAPFLYKALRILNSCDLSYRESSNKRLLVELTLIEVAQLLQKDDDASSGRLPWKILKSLFRNMVKQVQSQPAQQGSGTVSAKPAASIAATAAATNAATAATNATTTSPGDATTPAASQPAVKKVVKLGGIGMTFDNILAKPKTAVMEEVDKREVKEEKPFSNEELQMQWLAMCNRMGQNAEYKGLAQRLKNLVPVIKEFPVVELLVESSLMHDEASAIRRRMEFTLAKCLHNGNLSLEIRIAEASEKKLFLSPKETFEMMVASNEGLALLKAELDLDLE